jgi:zinc protease
VHAVTPEEVSRIARTYLDPSRMTIVVVGDRGQIEEQLRPYGEIRSD